MDAEEYFVKQTLRNRTYICGPNGKFLLIVPVKHTGGKLTAMKDIQISYDSPWQKIHWRSLVSTYRNSPWFEYYEDELTGLFSHKEKFLFDMNEKIVQALFKLTGINSEMGRTVEYIQNYSAGEFDLRNLSDPQFFFQSASLESILPYNQVFAKNQEFIHGLSILDILFNEGKNVLNFLAPGV